MAVSTQTLLFRILLRTGDQLRCSNWCSLFDNLVPLVDGSLGLTCLKLIFHRHQVSYVKTMYICCWPTYLSCVRSGDTNKKYNFVINHFLTHSSSPNIDRAPYTVARLYTKRTRLVADKLYSWYFLLFSVICANCDVFGMLMAANIGFRWAAYFCDRKVKDITRTGASSHEGVKYVFSSRFPSAVYCTQCHLPSIIREPP